MIDFSITNQPLLAEFSLAHITASLNAIACVLLVLAFLAIKRGKPVLHKQLMLTAFGVSSAFLVVYLTRYALEGNREFPSEAYPSVYPIYMILLISHIVLAVTVPVFALLSIYHGLKNNLEKHRKIAKLAFPIWMYVSVTGVLVYLMLYQIYAS